MAVLRPTLAAWPYSRKVVSMSFWKPELASGVAPAGSVSMHREENFCALHWCMSTRVKNSAEKLGRPLLTVRAGHNKTASEQTG